MKAFNLDKNDRKTLEGYIQEFALDFSLDPGTVERERINHQAIAQILQKIVDLPKAAKPYAEHLVRFNLYLAYYTQEEINGKFADLYIKDLTKIWI